MEFFEVKPLKTREITLSVPPSKSILSRALLLAAFTEGDTSLHGCGGMAQDTEDLLRCLGALGIRIERQGETLFVHGSSRFARKADLNVGSAGTAARFLTAILAFSGGNYRMTASEQMKKRPMELLSLLQEAGATVRFEERAGHFPFVLQSEGISPDVMSVDTDVSTQYASGLLLAAAVGKKPLTLLLQGNRTQGSYIATTLHVIRAFGGSALQEGEKITLLPIKSAPKSYAVAPDVSGACYFYALSLLCGAKVLVRGVHPACDQADLRFFDVLREKNVVITDTPAGMLADGSKVRTFTGFDLDMSDFSDQTMTVASLAPFASSPTILRNLGHIRQQECDRIAATVEALTALGVPCESRGEDILIQPAPVRPATIRSHGDHRVAMAFSLVGLKSGGVTIQDPDCCKKTFGNFFALLDELC